VHSRVASGASRAPVARASEVSKRFGGVVALAGVSIDLRAGSIHAVLGHNGAGKTTLMRIIAGLLHPDSGTLSFDGVARELRGRRDGIAAGVALVPQHFAQITEMSAVENLLLDRGHRPAAAGRRKLLADRTAAASGLSQAAAAPGFRLDPHARLRDLAFGERQRLELAMATARGCRVLILDEPTSLLGAADAEVFFEALRRMRDGGCAIAYVSHKLREVATLADTVTVLRAGRVAVSLTGSVGEADLAEAMIGDGPRTAPLAKPASRDRHSARPVVELHRVAAGAEHGGLRDCSLAVRPHEVVGVAGMIGSGQALLAEVLAGLAEPTAGSVDPRPREAAYIPEDRHRDGVAADFSLRDNLILHRHRDLTERGLLSLRRTTAAAAAALEGYGLDDDLERQVATLSGGNQQRVVLARELGRSPTLVVAHNPCAGLDVAAAGEVRSRLARAADEGAAVVLISPELDELFELCGRIDVLFEGSIIGSFDPAATSAAEIGQLIGGAGRREAGGSPHPPPRAAA